MAGFDGRGAGMREGASLIHRTNGRQEDTWGAKILVPTADPFDIERSRLRNRITASELDVSVSAQVRG